MATNKNEILSKFAEKNYPDSKADLFGMFMEKSSALCTCFYSMINQKVWMTSSSFKDLRPKLLSNTTIVMADLGPHAFDEIGGEIVQTVSFVNSKHKLESYFGLYKRLIDFVGEENKEAAFFDQANTYLANEESFSNIPGAPVSYWVSENIFKTFKNTNLKETIHPKQGTSTGDDETYVRFWHEIDYSKYSTDQDSTEEAINSGFDYFPLDKGGEYRKWFGNNEKVIKMNKDAYSKLLKLGNHLPSKELYFKVGITWSKLSSNHSAFRYDPKGFVFSSVRLKGFPIDNEKEYILGFLNSKLTDFYLAVISPGLSTVSGDIEKLPVKKETNEEKRRTIKELVKTNIDLCKTDWDSFETSWDFARHPLMPAVPEQDVIAVKSVDLRPKVDSEYKGHNIKIADMFGIWSKECDERFAKLKANEEELNRIFIEIYGLQDELTPEVVDKDVTVRKADLVRDIKSFISYAVGCMLGRYSISVDGLVYAGGDSFVPDVYKPFDADKDNVIPVTDKAYFDDDIVGRFSKFVETVYGKETLDENLQFIADAIGGNGKEPLGVIRNYFLNDFYKDHCKMYQKKPIYWMFDAGKKNSFKALIYMHRYEETTIANLRTEYVHQQQTRFKSIIEDLEKRSDSATGSAKIKLGKELTEVKEQDGELHVFEEKIHHLADQMIKIDLDDGVKHNYEIFGDVLAKTK